MKNLETDTAVSSPSTIGEPRRVDSRFRGNDNTQHVLFLSLSGIGNLIMQLPAIHTLKQSHPTWHITVWVAPRGTKAIAEAQPYIDKVIEMPVSPPYQGGPARWAGGAGGGLVQHIKNVFTLRKNHFDIGIVLSPGQLRKSALYLKLAGIKTRIGNSYSYKDNQNSSQFLTDSISEDSALHDIEQNLKLLEPLDIHTENIKGYSLEIPEKNIAEARQSLPLTKGDLPASRSLGEGWEGVKYVGIHAGCATGYEFKRWPLERFAEVAKMLIQKYPNIKILVFGGSDEEEQKKELTDSINTICHPRPDRGSTITDGLDSRLRGNDNIVAIRISASLLTTAAIMQHCKLFISNDSGLMHLAAASGVPTIGIFGPTDEHQTGPRGVKNNFVIRAPGTTPIYNTELVYNLGISPHETLLAVTPQLVFDKIIEIGVLT